MYILKEKENIFTHKGYKSKLSKEDKLHPRKRAGKKLLWIHPPVAGKIAIIYFTFPVKKNIQFELQSPKGRTSAISKKTTSHWEDASCIPPPLKISTLAKGNNHHPSVREGTANRISFFP